MCGMTRTRPCPSIRATAGTLFLPRAACCTTAHWVRRARGRYGRRVQDGCGGTLARKFATSETGARSFAQTYWLPTVRTGSITARANVKLTVALRGRVARKLSISPLAITLPLGRRLSGGVAVEMAAAEDARTRFGTGLQLRFKLPGGALGVDALRDVTGNRAQLRLFFASIFHPDRSSPHPVPPLFGRGGTLFEIRIRLKREESRFRAYPRRRLPGV